MTKGAGTPNAATWASGFDPSTLGTTAEADPDGNTSSATFYSNGLPDTTTDADGNMTSYTYNSFDEPLTVTDPKGIETSYTYDSDGNVLTKTVTGVGGSPSEETHYTYGDGHAGDLTQVQDPDGHITSYTYDTYGDRISTTTYPDAGAAAVSATNSADHFTYGDIISAVGSLADDDGTGVTTLSVSPQHVGDLVALSVRVSSSSISVSSISGGGVSTWTRQREGPYSGYGGNDFEIWTGVVSSTGSSTVTVSFSGSVASDGVELTGQEFSAASGSSTTWGLDTGAGVSTPRRPR